ncbi:unnamed protein product [Onchocerca flexuosa]|uniref:Uncharacterized protein n=1 Tax=Onchocerca flexuosa TaxID=387005 RepID=A0A3P7TXR5_9BILA|nr:unnamed protein product [Onchocerca flexuosa]
MVSNCSWNSCVFQLKFRKVVDVKRERELDERRKNEKLTVPAEHPVRKLLFRMRERHGRRLLPSQIFADLERVGCSFGNIRKYDAFIRGTKQIRTRSSGVRLTSSSADDLREMRWSINVQQNTDAIVSSIRQELGSLKILAFQKLPPELKICFERIEEKLHTVNCISHKLENLEKLVFGLYHQAGGSNKMNINGSKDNEQPLSLAPTMAMDLTSRTIPDQFAPFSSSPYTESTTPLPICIPPLQDLSTDDGNGEFQTSTPNFGMLVYVEDEIANGSLSPPKLKRI